MSRFVFLINTTNIPKKQKIIVNLTSGFLFLLGFIIVVFSFITLFPILTDEIGFNSKGKSTFIAVFIVGSIFCGIAYFIAFILNDNWKREANKQKKYDDIFSINDSFTISNSFTNDWDNSIRNVFKKPGILNLIYFRGAYTENLCFVDCRHVGPLNKGADYSLVIINHNEFDFQERGYFVNSKKALNILKVDTKNSLAFNFIKSLDVDMIVILDKNTVTLEKLHKLTKPELFSIYSTVTKFFIT
jgi:hypothetical protein